VLFLIREPKEFANKGGEKPAILESLRQVVQGKEKSALLILLAIFSWFVAYNAVEAFFTLYAVNHLGQSEADGSRLLGQLSLIFVLFSLPSGYIGSRIGRRVTIMMGLLVMFACVLLLYFLPVATLITELTRLPVLGVVPVTGLVLMLAGLGWSLIYINSLPMVVDMTDAVRIGTYTGLYYLFSTLAAIAGPNINGYGK
jgi:MFS family permease